MCDDIAEAPADVPATTAPWRKRSSIASASRVPPIVDESRSWLPPVRNTPVASRTASAAVSSLACGRVMAWSGRTVGDAQLGEDLAVALAGLGPERAGGRDHRDRRVPAARERHEPVEDHPVADLVLRPADDDDGAVAHRGRIADGRSGEAQVPR